MTRNPIAISNPSAIWPPPARRLLRRAAGAVGVMALLWFVGTGPTGAAENDEAGAFVSSLTAAAIEQLTDAAVPRDERKARFRTLFKQNFDLPAIGRFVVGRYWRGASAKAQEDFLAAFEDVMVERFVPQFEGYVDTNFQVVLVREAQGKDRFMVSSTITPPGREKVAIDWLVRREDGQFKVLDVIGEGVSMALTLRSEYASVIKRSGGTIDGLTALLRERAEQDAGLAKKASGG
jgi:phospholipid transport system substrate-binding protein